MKIAICIAGEIRPNFKKNLESFNLNLRCILPNFDIFVSTWEGDLTKDFIDLVKPIKYKLEYFAPEKLVGYEEFVKTNSIPACKNIIPMLYKCWDGLNLIDDSYDIIIRTRPDLLYATPIDLYQIINLFYNQQSIGIHIDKTVGCEGWLFDGFAIGSYNAVKKYSELYLNFIEEAQASGSLISHIVLKDFLLKKNINVIHLNNVIGLIRKEPKESVCLHFHNTPEKLLEIGLKNFNKIIFSK